jgi:hypothetical protein
MPADEGGVPMSKWDWGMPKLLWVRICADIAYSQSWFQGEDTLSAFAYWLGSWRLS